MRHISFFCLILSLASCSVILKDKEEIEKIIEDVIEEEVSGTP